MRTALITGGSRGIGKACVQAFVREGYHVAFFYLHSKKEAETLEKTYGAKGFQCNIASSVEVRTVMEKVLHDFRHIDVLVNNAGIAQQKLLTDCTDEDWQQMLSTHLSGTFHCCRAALPGMVSQKNGRIINIGSIWGQVGASCEAHYAAAKAGLIGLTKSLAKEYGPSGITANCVCPGVIETDMLASFSEQDKAEMAEATPVGRLGTPEDVANAVLFLAKQETSFITAQILGVNGGFGE